MAPTTRKGRRRNQGHQDEYFRINTLELNIDNNVSNENDNHSEDTSGTSVHAGANALGPSGASDSNNSADIGSLPQDLLRSLRGSGPHSASRMPIFDNKSEHFNNWLLQLKHFLLIQNLQHHLQATTINATDNLALYMAIASCLNGSSLELVQTQAFANGQEALRLLKQKYLGNFHCREAKSMIALATLKQGESEDLPSYMTRCENIVNDIEEFKTIRNSNFYTTMALNGINGKYEIFKTIISSDKIPEWSVFKERLESHGSMSSFDKSSNRILNVNSSTSPHIIKNRSYKNYAKFVNNKRCQKCLAKGHNTEDCWSTKYCGKCNNASHDEIHCRYANKQQINHGTRGITNTSRRGFVPQRQLFNPRGRVAAARRPYYVATRGNRGRTNTSANGRGRINNILHSMSDSDHQNYETHSFYEQDLGSGYEYGNPNNAYNYQNFENTETANTLTQNPHHNKHTVHSANNIQENNFDLNNMFF